MAPYFWRAKGALLSSDDTTDNMAALQSLADLGGTIVIPPTESGRYVVSGPVTLSVPGTQIIAWGAPVRQSTNGQTIFRVTAADCLIDGLDAFGVASPDMSGMGTAWEGSILLSRWCAVNVYASAHRLRIPWIRGRGMSSVVRISGWDADTDLEALFPVEDVKIGTLLCDKVEFGVAAKATKRLSVACASGTYGNVTAAPRPSHLVYLADSTLGHSGPVVGDCSASDGVGGCAYQLKAVAAGKAGRLVADGCAGVLNVVDCNGLDVADVTSAGDTWAATSGGSLTVDSTVATSRVRIRNLRIDMTEDYRAVAVLSGSDVDIDDLRVDVAHTTTGTSTQFDVDIRGSGNTLGRVNVVNSGANAWRAVGIFSGTGHVVRDVRASGVRIGVDTRATDAVVHYDSRDISLHGTDGYSVVTATAGGWALFCDAKYGAFLSPNNLLVADTFSLPTGSSSVLGATVTGHSWTTYSTGSWVCDGSDRCFESTAAATQAAVVDAVSADVQVECGIVFQSGEGIVFRAIDASNYLMARFSAGALTLSKREAAVTTTLATAAITTQAGRRYHLMASMFSDLIDVYVDGVAVLTHTLSAGDQTTFGAATLHGMRSSGSASARFDSFRVLGI